MLVQLVRTTAHYYAGAALIIIIIIIMLLQHRRGGIMNHVAVARALQLQLQQCRYYYCAALRLYLALTKSSLIIADYSELLYMQHSALL